MFIDFSKKLEYIASRSRIGLITSHANSDPDALASMIIALRILESLGVESCLAPPEGLSKLSKTILETLGFELIYCPEMHSLDLCFIVDASNPVQLGEYWSLCNKARVKVLVDHHEPSGLADIIELKLIDKNASSTSELMVLIADSLGLKLTPKDATLAALGIIYDSRMFYNASLYTFRAMSLLYDWGCDYSLAAKIIGEKRRIRVEDLSYRVAVIKALSRLRLERACRDLLIVATHIGSYESEVANTLLYIGADIAIVIAERENRARVSIRVSDRALASRINASNLASYIASKFGGEGGGHDRVAMANIVFNGDVEALTDNISRSIQGRVGRICLGESRVGEG
ncbi:MAG: DHH family phosphoesterase [Acidilobaceae archaeon]